MLKNAFLLTLVVTQAWRVPLGSFAAFRPRLEHLVLEARWGLDYPFLQLVCLQIGLAFLLYLNHACAYTVVTTKAPGSHAVLTTSPHVTHNDGGIVRDVVLRVVRQTGR